jgi:hypothetical protein
MNDEWKTCGRLCLTSLQALLQNLYEETEENKKKSSVTVAILSVEHQPKLSDYEAWALTIQPWHTVT